MANKIQVRRGTKAQLTALGALALGEPGYATDTGEFYIGNGSGANTKVSASDAERGAWNAKETTVGSQAKVDTHAALKATDTGGVHGIAFETGTWLPTLRDMSSNPLSHVAQFGKYEKLNKKVTATFYLETNGLNSASGQIIITGLPFSEDQGFRYSEVLHYIVTVSDVEMVEAMASNSYLTLRVKKTGAAIGPATTANTPSSLALSGTITYFTA